MGEPRRREAACLLDVAGRGGGGGVELRGPRDVNRLAFGCRVRADEDFTATLWTSSTGSVLAARLRTSNITAEREGNADHDHYGRYLQLSLVIGGRVALEQRGSRAIAAPGQAFAICLDRPFRSVLSRGDAAAVDVLHLYVSIGALTAWGLEPAAAGGQVWALSGAAVAALLLARDLACGATSPAHLGIAARIDEIVFRSAVVALLERDLAGAAIEMSAEEYLRRRAIDIIDRGFTDPGMNPDAVAQLLHVSRRTLFRAFELQGLSVAGLIRTRRLVDAATALGENSRSIREIAETCGFRTADQFSRAFRAEYGVTPAAYRTARRRDALAAHCDRRALAHTTRSAL
ncbi:helix-turn-helix transcriptional regulator [Nocardia caishijiensis]|uniref:helix-turn-helix transcriptional regulator n=1 Tax=Nocardia caishijiensis TaxID=184756 RepID=UPI0013317237|nr:AraC family transcriptional regulator [Nocardia caishijiensis]